MATYGQVRPSVSFTSGARVARPVTECAAVDMTSLPPTWMDPKEYRQEATLEVPPPPKEVDSSFLKMYENHSLMLPSERYKEHLAMKAGAKKWEEEKNGLRMYNKRMKVLERHYPQGVLGLDGPMFPNTRYYKERRAHMEAMADYKDEHAGARFGSLAEKAYANDATSHRKYGEPHEMERSRDICAQRKRVDPQAHPHRFLNTHERLFPPFVPTWDPDRAAALRSHDVRDRRHNFLNGANHDLTYKVASSWDKDPLDGMPGAGALPRSSVADVLSQSAPSVVGH